MTIMRLLRFGSTLCGTGASEMYDFERMPILIQVVLVGEQ